MASILIIDDDATWQNLLRKPIDINKHRIEFADSLDESTNKLQKTKYHLIIADLKLAKTQTNLFDALGKIILLQEDAYSSATPIIVVTGESSYDRKEILDALNKYPGKVWGWHEKPQFEQDTYRQNVIDILKEKQSKWWHHLLTVVGLFGLVFGSAWIFGAKFTPPQAESLLSATATTTVILALLVIMMANPDRSSSIMPILRKYLFR